MSENLLCKGDWQLGTACGTCSRCRTSAVEAITKMRADPWQPMETAPRDGNWFYALRIIVLVGVDKPARTLLDLSILRRERSSPDSSGYWLNTAGNSVADQCAGDVWAPLDALPIAKILKAKEARRRAIGGEPMDLPVPFGSGGRSA